MFAEEIGTTSPAVRHPVPGLSVGVPTLFEDIVRRYWVLNPAVITLDESTSNDRCADGLLSLHVENT